jgi:hypothetical protein
LWQNPFLHLLKEPLAGGRILDATNRSSPYLAVRPRGLMRVPSLLPHASTKKTNNMCQPEPAKQALRGKGSVVPSIARISGTPVEILLRRSLFYPCRSIRLRKLDSELCRITPKWYPSSFVTYIFIAPVVVHLLSPERAAFCETSLSASGLA